MTNRVCHPEQSEGSPKQQGSITVEFVLAFTGAAFAFALFVGVAMRAVEVEVKTYKRFMEWRTELTNTISAEEIKRWEDNPLWNGEV